MTARETVKTKDRKQQHHKKALEQTLTLEIILHGMGQREGSAHSVADLIAMLHICLSQLLGKTHWNQPLKQNTHFDHKSTGLS